MILCLTGFDIWIFEISVKNGPDQELSLNKPLFQKRLVKIEILKPVNNAELS